MTREMGRVLQDGAGNHYVNVENVRVTLVLAKDRPTEKDWPGQNCLRIQAYRGDENDALCQGAELPIGSDPNVSRNLIGIMKAFFMLFEFVGE